MTDTQNEKAKALAFQAFKAEKNARQTRFGWTMGATDRVLSDNCTGLEVVHQPHQVPGWTDGETVTINAFALPPLVDEDGRQIPNNLVVWLGVNAHEVGHTMFSPRKGSPLDVKLGTKEASYPGIKRLENLAEDQRQERLTIGRFRPWGVYLAAAAVRLIAEAHMTKRDNDADRSEALGLSVDDLWPLVAGRTWLPAEVRRIARDAWDAALQPGSMSQRRPPGSAQRIADLIGEYQRIPDPGYEDAKDAVRVLMDLHSELNDAGVMPQNMAGAGCSAPGGHGEETGDALHEGDMPNVGEVDDSKVPSAGSEEDNDALDNAKPEDSGEDTGEGEGSDGESADGGVDRHLSNEDDPDSDEDGSDGSGEGDEDTSDGDAGTGSGESEGGGESDDGEGSGEGEDDADGNQGQSSGTGSAPPSQTLEDLQGPINDAVREALANDPGVRKDLGDVSKALDPGRRHTSSLKHEDDGSWHSVKLADIPVSTPTRRLARAVSEHLRLLVDETLPQWNRRVETGKLNVGRYMRRDVGDPLDDMFDRFQQGMQDDVSLDVSILVDVSDSMGFTPKLGVSPKDENGMPTRWPPLITPAAEACWAIQRAVEAAEGEVTVYGFNTEAHIISDTGRRVHPDIVKVPNVGGGTDPTDLLNEVWARLPSVQARHKIVVAITDGMWQGGGPVMEQLSARGVITIGVVLDSYLNTRQGGNRQGGESKAAAKQRTEAHVAQRAREMAGYLEKMGVTYGKVMEDPHDMVPMFDRVVSEVMIKAMQGVA